MDTEIWIRYNFHISHNLLSLFFFWFFPQLFKHVKNTRSSQAMWEQVMDRFVTFGGRKSPRPWISLWELAQPLTNSTNMAHGSPAMNGCYESGKQVLFMTWARRLRAQCTFLGYNFKSVVLTLTRHLRYKWFSWFTLGRTEFVLLFILSVTLFHFFLLFLPQITLVQAACAFLPEITSTVGACVSCGCHLTQSPLVLTSLPGRRYHFLGKSSPCSSASPASRGFSFLPRGARGGQTPAQSA